MFNIALAQLQHIDPTPLLGIGFAMHIEAAIEYLKYNWRLPAQLSPYVASVLSLVVQIGLSFFFHVPLTEALVGVIFTTAASCFWHELSTPSN